MENSIEHIWKQGFLNESSLVAPQVNDLYNRKSINVVERIKQRMKQQKTVSLIIILSTPVIFYFLGAFWYGLAFTVSAFIISRYMKGQLNSIRTLDHGATSYDYLKSFNDCLKDNFRKTEKIVRFSLPLYVLIGLSGTWASWNKLGILTILQQRHPTVNVELYALLYLATGMLVAILFPVKLYRWEVRMTYGRLLDKLKQTIAEMEKLKQGE
nr:hypothetical protein [uncultured Mucilaginibacter sp.]